MQSLDPIINRIAKAIDVEFSTPLGAFNAYGITVSALFIIITNLRGLTTAIVYWIVSLFGCIIIVNFYYKRKNSK